MLAKQRIFTWIGYFGFILCLFTIPNTASYGQEKEYPVRPIKIIVHTTPGGAADLWARAWSDEFSKILNVPVVLSNQGGASGMAAWIDAAGAKPDGYTLATTSNSIVIGYALSPETSVDVFKDLVFIGGFGSHAQLIVVEKSSPFMTYEDFFEYAKKNPGKLKCGTGGVTIIGHFNFELLRKHANIDVLMVPFQGAPQAVTALLGKHVDLLSTVPQPLIGFLKEGRVRGLLATQKMKDFPNIPLFSEKGMAAAGITTWFGIAAPSGISKGVQAKLADALGKISKDPKVMERMGYMAITPDYQTPGGFEAILREDYQKIRNAAKQGGLIK